MINVLNLKISYRDLVFEKVSFLLGNNEKVGLVGLNGTGKSTLLKILAGIEKQDEGSIEISTNEKIAYLPQEFSITLNESPEEDILVGLFLESLVDYDVSQLYRVKKVLAQLSLTEIDEFQTVGNLSPGQKMKLYLAKLLINEPTILLLDEPTNHLDIEGILWFESFCNEFKGICIIISHDRAFLNTVVNKVFELDEKTLRIWEGNYDDFLESKFNYINDRAKIFKAQERKRKKFEDLIDRIKKQAGGEAQSKALKAARTRLNREVLKNEVSKYKDLHVNKFDIAGEVAKTKKMLEIKNLYFKYPNSEEYLLKDLNFVSYGNEHVWITGPNGIGKTTLIKIIINELNAEKGDVVWGENIRWEYFSQDQKHIPSDETVENYFLNNTGISYNSSFGLMERFLFSKEMRGQKIKNLSPGQRARLSFAVFAQHSYECLILDEPTNHIDIKTKEIIEEALREFKGAIFLISHDRYFAENIRPDRVITIEKGRIQEL